MRRAGLTDAKYRTPMLRITRSAFSGDHCLHFAAVAFILDGGLPTVGAAKSEGLHT